MKTVRLSEVITFQNSEKCTAYEYPFNDGDINIALVEINGRYPESGRALNQKCKEVGYVVEGKGKVVVEGVEFELRKGDSVLIEAGEQFYWEGSLTMLMSCTPAWTQEQHRIVV